MAIKFVVSEHDGSLSWKVDDDGTPLTEQQALIVALGPIARCFSSMADSVQNIAEAIEFERGLDHIASAIERQPKTAAATPRKIAAKRKVRR